MHEWRHPVHALVAPPSRPHFWTSLVHLTCSHPQGHPASPRSLWYSLVLWLGVGGWAGQVRRTHGIVMQAAVIVCLDHALRVCQLSTHTQTQTHKCKYVRRFACSCAHASVLACFCRAQLNQLVHLGYHIQALRQFIDHEHSTIGVPKAYQGGSIYRRALASGLQG